MVFGLALSIGSLILIGKVPQSGQELGINVLLFGFSFLIVVGTWLAYSRVMAVLPTEVPFALLANLVLLFCVAIEPYLFYVLQTVQSLDLLDPASIAYALDVGAMYPLLAALSRLVVKQEETRKEGRQSIHPVMLARFRRAMKAEALVGGIFFVSALPIFWVNTPVGPLRFYLWFSAFLGFVVRRGPRRAPSGGG
jgi:uncharacterized membrane protein